MSEQPTLYRANPSPIEGEEDTIERLAAFRAIVPVEPVGKIEVYSKRETVDDTHTISIRTDKTLKPGRYAIVRLDDE